MKIRSIIILITTLLCIIILVLIWMCSKGAHSFISSFDGNNKDLSENRIIKNYYFVDLDKQILIKEDDVYRIAQKNVDSLCWNNKLIFGYSINRYFKINLNNDSVHFFFTKDSILLDENVKTLKHLSELPSLVKN